MRHCYEVVSPPMEYIDYIPGLGDGPTEFGVDWCIVWGRSKREAVKAAVRHWQRRCGRPNGYWSPNPCCYPHRQREDGLNPYAGIKAQQIDPRELAVHR
jgi:hypothetical protein